MHFFSVKGKPRLFPCETLTKVEEKLDEVTRQLKTRSGVRHYFR